MQFYKLKDVAQSYSAWVLGIVTVSPILDDRVSWIAELLPTEYKHYFISGLGILGLIARAIIQPKLRGK